jgi:hypothetical protein
VGSPANRKRAQGKPGESAKHTTRKAESMKLYYHKTDGGAEYLCSEPVEEGSAEGSLRSKYIVRIDGNIKRDAELLIK